VLLGGKAQWTLASFDQERTDVSGGSDPSIAAFATSTKTTGIEASLNYQVTRKWFLGLALTELDPRYLNGANAEVFDVTAKELGFQDVIAPNGDIYPAEAFGYGGRQRIVLTDPNNIYDEVQGQPKVQAALNTTYNIGKGWGVLANVQYFEETTVYNAGVTWDKENVHVKANVYNLTDELYFRATNGGNSNMVSVMPDRRYEISVKIDF
jgi:outer membrane receptor protein involved in Fe transport